MAGDWIKMRSNLWDHPKVVRILSALCPQSVRDASAKCRIIGALYRTWALADAHTLDGILDGYDADALDALVGIEGWSINLEQIGWLVVEPQRLIVPRFEEHNGQSAKRRAEDAARKMRVRKASADCPQDVRTRADKKRTREEKRREDIPPLSPKGEAERVLLVSLVAKQNVHRAKTVVAAALERGCTTDQIAEAARICDGKALATLLETLRPPTPEAAAKRAVETREERRLRLIKANDVAGVSREETNRALLAEGLEGVVVPQANGNRMQERS